MTDFAPTLTQPDATSTIQPLPPLISGMWRSAPHMGDYRTEWLQEMLVERVTWGEEAPTVQLRGVTVAAPGHIWFRFWLPEQQQVVEKYFDAKRQPLGLYVPLCAPLQRQGEGYSTTSLLLALWLDLSGRVMMMHEDEFESAAASGRMTPDQAELAETNIRLLTGGVAQATFPPAMVRNFALA
jgi:predicted RNA-binding protein associated with RNAse of E/G family